jgi:DNA phosphorothioation system restriction enzyme
MLKICNFKVTYNTSDDNISNDFYNMTFTNSIKYYRGVGYFTSGWLRENSYGLARFIKENSEIKFITSPNLDKSDLQALNGEFNKDIVNKIILNNIVELENKLENETRNLLGWLVSDGYLEFKFAIPTRGLEGGEFHDKFGVFIDSENSYVSFNGSQNDSIKAYKNYESISVFKSWGDDTSKILAKETLNRFNKIWKGEDKNLLIYDLDELSKNKLIKFKTKDRPYNTAVIKNKIESKKTYPSIPDNIKLRDYQKEAYKSWVKNNYRGLLCMATGSGKTITAFSSIANLLEEKNELCVLVVVPYQHLLTQWSDEAKFFNIEFIQCFENSSKWFPILSSAISAFNIKSQKQLFIITTNSTYIGKKFQELVKQIDTLLLVVDEAHNFGSLTIRDNYLDNAIYRLGLSATPQRHLDDEGTKAILSYLGDIVFEYTLEEAINAGQLTPYNYYPVLVYLTNEEEEEFIELSKKISKMSQYEKSADNSLIEILLIKRAKIIAGAKNKLPSLEKLLVDENLIRTQDNLFYCAATKDEENETKMVDQVYKMLSRKGMIIDKFTSFDADSKTKRKNLINNLADNTIDGLVAIKCLDEGVDIPSVKRAFILSSSTNPKEFIQRRGRVLRKFKGKDFAEIYDFMVIPSGSSSKEEVKFQKKYLENELKRYREFAKLALNYPACEKPLIDLAAKYNLLHI